jgi:HEAT repeat protein
MKEPNAQAAAGTIVAIAAISTVSVTATDSLDELIAKIKSTDDKIRGPAWQSAAPYGAPAVKPLAALMTDPELEVARAAKRALWKIVRYAGRPGAGQEKSAVAAELLGLVKEQSAAVRREALWMLSEIGEEQAVASIAGLLNDRELHEDARAALERIPGSKSLAALRDGLKTAQEEFRPAIANSLRVRGMKVAEYPSQKLVPTRPANPAVSKST